MNRSFTRRVVAGTAVVVMATVAERSSADNIWNNYHWARSTPSFTLLTGDNVDASWDPYLTGAIADWRQSGVVLLERTGGRAKSKNCRPTAGRIEVCSGAYGQNGWLGIAQIWISGSHITQATTRLNDTYFNLPTYNTPAWRRLVTCQEIAHDFGLAHQDEVFTNRNLGSCMDYTSDPNGGGDFGPSNEHPNSHDFSMIDVLYGHLDSFTTAGATTSRNGAPAAMNQIDFDGPGQWGRLVRSSRNGRVQVYELDFGKGHKVLSHVFWADPEADAQH